MLGRRYERLRAQPLISPPEHQRDTAPQDREPQTSADRAVEAQAGSPDRREDPGGTQVTESVHDRVDDVLGPVAARLLDHGEADLPAGPGDGVLRNLPHDLQRLHHQQRRRQRQHHERHDHDDRIEQQAGRHAKPGDEAAEAEDQDQRGSDVDYQRDVGDRHRAALDAAECVGDGLGLEEVSDGVDPGHQQHECGLIAREAGFEHLAEACERIAGEAVIEAGALGLGTADAQALLLPHQQMNDDDHHQEPRRGEQQQAAEPQRMHSEARHQRSRDRAGAAACRNQSEQPRRLARGEHIDDQAPEDRDHEQVRNAEPPVVGRSEPATLRCEVKQRLEQHDVEHPEPEHAGQQTLQPDARGQPRVEGRGQERTNESAGEQILQLIRAKHRRRRVAHGSEDVVATHHHEVAQERERDGATLLRLDASAQIDQAYESRGGWR